MYDICKRDLVTTANPEDLFLVRTVGEKHFNEIKLSDLQNILGSGGGGNPVDDEVIVIRHDASSADIFYNIPSISTFSSNQRVIHKRIDTSSENTVTLVPFSGETIDSSYSLELRILESYTLLTDTSRNNWDII